MKKSCILAIITGVLDVLLFIGGIVGDIVYWNWVYNHREPDATGHGVPLISVIAVFVIIVFSATMALCIYMVSLVEKRREKEKAN